MITETITYRDFDGRTVSDELSFHITKSTMTDNLDLENQFKEAAALFEGEERTLATYEVKLILDLVKSVMKLAYGVRTVKDGRVRFDQSDGAWADFRASAAYDEFLMSLFQDVEKAMNFIVRVFPQDLMDEARAQVEAEGGAVPAAVAPVEEEKPAMPAPELSDEALLKMDPMKMTREQMLRAMRLKTA